MAHYSEMDFLFSSKINRDQISGPAISNSNNYNNIFDNKKFVVYKQEFNKVVNSGQGGTNNIKKYYKDQLYKDSNINPYSQLIKDFNGKPALRIKPSHIAYLRDLGVYPLNRMAILRRFPEGAFVSEDLDTMTIEPISTVVGWIKPDQNFGNIEANETWTTTNKRFDVLLAEIINSKFKVPVTHLMPEPDYLQGVLFQFYKEAGFINAGGPGQSKDEGYEVYDAEQLEAAKEKSWGLVNIPVGDPNVLKQGPYRDPTTQNIESEFNFELETVYEQKLIGDVDPGSALLDILDNIFVMGTSNMAFYWGDVAPAIVAAKKTVQGKANSPTLWWEFVSEVLTGFWKAIQVFFKQIVSTTLEITEQIIKDASSALTGSGNDTMEQSKAVTTFLELMKSILTATVATYRFELRGSIELMTGGDISATPWYLTLGNPYTPFIATNHIKVTKCKVESSREMGFNDMPQWVKATFSCALSRPLGKQEIMRMLNNSYKRTYMAPDIQVFEGFTLEQMQNLSPEQMEKLSKSHPELYLNDLSYDEWYNKVGRKQGYLYGEYEDNYYDF